MYSTFSSCFYHIFIGNEHVRLMGSGEGSVEGLGGENGGKETNGET